MKKLIEQFTKQLAEAIQIGSKANFTDTSIPLQNVLISGLGGSGIGGTIVSEIVAGPSPLPVIVNKDYNIPSFVGPQTLVVISSYSGNTEETVSAFEAAIEKKAKIVCVTSGGIILEMAKKLNIDVVVIPGGLPPRACLAYSFTQLLFVLHAFRLIPFSIIGDLTKSISFIDVEELSIQKEAREVAVRLFGKMPVIYSVAGSEGIAIRFRQQINENSKELCWHHTIPEMNHNELVGWKSGNEKLAVIFLRNSDDYTRNSARTEINKKLIREHSSSIVEIWAKGHSRIERTLYLIHLVDWVSVFLAELKNVDPVEVKVIDFLKSELGQLKS